tara:strand:- start:1990 stop:2241 length:252 start_codon:yes stop_codon:yes gene_type:complete
MTSQYLWFLIFGIILYVIAVDENVAKAADYVITLIKNNFRKQWWWITNNPKNPIVKYLMWRRSMKLAKDLRAKIDKKLKEKNG